MYRDTRELYIFIFHIIFKYDLFINFINKLKYIFIKVYNITFKYY